MDKETRNNGIAGLVVFVVAVLFFGTPLVYVLTGTNLFSTNNTLNFIFSLVATISLSAPLLFLISWARVALKEWHAAYKGECRACQSRHCKLTGHKIKSEYLTVTGDLLLTCERCAGRWRIDYVKMRASGVSDFLEQLALKKTCTKFLSASLIGLLWYSCKIYVAAKVSDMCAKAVQDVSLIYAHLEKDEAKVSDMHAKVARDVSLIYAHLEKEEARPNVDE